MRNELLSLKSLIFFNMQDPRSFWDAIHKLGPKGTIGEIQSEVILEDGSVRMIQR